MRWLRYLALALAALWLGNSSWLRGTPGQTQVLAHRGVHQVFPLEGVTNDTCTATRIGTPHHTLIENTLPSMAAAFAAGAAVVELDIHPTTDGHWAVFHDWTIDCRTEGSGVVRDLAWEDIRHLDPGYGYTADGGKSFPLRGQGARIPELEQVFAAFPEGRFLINFKGAEATEGADFAAWLGAHPVARDRIWAVYGAAGPVRASGLPGYDPARIKSCLLTYAATGWTGYLPASCRGAPIVVPVNLAPLLWGWPHLFTARMREGGAEVILLGPWSGGGFSSGIDDPALVARVPEGFDGLVWTNRIETVGPALAAR